MTSTEVMISPSNEVHSLAKEKDDNDASSSSLLASWYKKETLLQAINNFEPAKRNIGKPFRFIVSDIDTEGKYLYLSYLVLSIFN